LFTELDLLIFPFLEQEGFRFLPLQSTASHTSTLGHLLVGYYPLIYTKIPKIFPSSLGFVLKPVGMASHSFYLPCKPHTLSFHYYKVYYICCDKIRNYETLQSLVWICVSLVYIYILWRNVLYRDTKYRTNCFGRWVAWRTDSCCDIHCSNNSVRIRFLTSDPYRFVQSILYGIVNVQSVPAQRKWNNWCGVCRDSAASQTVPTSLLHVG
jgi:hypothetical protein